MFDPTTIVLPLDVRQALLDCAEAPAQRRDWLDRDQTVLGDMFRDTPDDAVRLLAHHVRAVSNHELSLRRGHFVQYAYVGENDLLLVLTPMHDSNVTDASVPLFAIPARGDRLYSISPRLHGLRSRSIY